MQCRNRPFDRDVGAGKGGNFTTHGNFPPRRGDPRGRPQARSALASLFEGGAPKGQRECRFYCQDTPPVTAVAVPAPSKRGPWGNLTPRRGDPRGRPLPQKNFVILSGTKWSRRIFPVKWVRRSFDSHGFLRMTFFFTYTEHGGGEPPPYPEFNNYIVGATFGRPIPSPRGKPLADRRGRRPLHDHWRYKI